MNYAAALLKSDKSLKVADVAGLVGYDSPSKFTAAFHQTMEKRHWNIGNQLSDWHRKAAWSGRKTES